MLAAAGERWQLKVRAKAAGPGGRGRRRLSRVAARVLADAARSPRGRAPGLLPLRPPAPLEELIRYPGMSPKGPVQGSPFFFSYSGCMFCGAARACPCGAKSSRAERGGARVQRGRGRAHACLGRGRLDSFRAL